MIENQHALKWFYHTELSKIIFDINIIYLQYQKRPIPRIGLFIAIIFIVSFL